MFCWKVIKARPSLAFVSLLFPAGLLYLLISTANTYAGIAPAGQVLGYASEITNRQIASFESHESLRRSETSEDASTSSDNQTPFRRVEDHRLDPQQQQQQQQQLQVSMSGEYMDRLLRSQKVCATSKHGVVRRIMQAQNFTLANCIIPKSGCTFWIGIFRYIKGETGGIKYESPFDIPRWTIHYGKKSKEFNMKSSKDQPDFFNKAFRYMFVRDPYKRVWSSWIDKFLLPDYWFSEGRRITTANKRPSNEIQCPMNITFTELLTYMAQDSFLSSPTKLNEHWAPYRGLCDPCTFQPHFIGKMETFAEDSRFVLKNANLSWVADRYLNEHDDNNGNDSMIPVSADFDLDLDLGNETKPSLEDADAMILQTRDKHSLREMEILVKYNIDNVWSPNKVARGCASYGVVASRLWKAFQYNGYIPLSLDIPPSLKVTEDLGSSGWKRLIRQAYSHWDKDPAHRFKAQSMQKKKVMEEAYAQVPMDVLKKIQSLYMQDFLQFDYDPQPDYVFQRDS